MIVLAIDPGSVTAGYALLKKEGRKIHYITSGILKFNGQDQFLHRVKDIYDQTLALLEKHQPDEVAMESLIFVKSPTALIKLAQSRGTMLAAMSHNYHEKIFEYSPNLVKSTVAGHGHADKEGIQKVLMQYLGLSNFKLTMKVMRWQLLSAISSIGAPWLQHQWKAKRKLKIWEMV